MGINSLDFQATAESQHNATAEIQPQSTAVTPKDCDYFYMPLKASLLGSFDQKNSNWFDMIWGEFVNTFLARASGTAVSAEHEAIQAFSGWLLPPGRDQIMRDMGKSAKEARKLAKFLDELGPPWTTLLVVDFAGNLDSVTPAPAFDDFEYLRYQTADRQKQGADVVRFVFPLAFKLPRLKFERLKGTIQKWVDSCAGDQPSDPASYEIGRICAMPAAAPDGTKHTQAFYNPGGNTLNWLAFESMLETGSLEMVIA